jgi:hypothetical protein
LCLTHSEHSINNCGLRKERRKGKREGGRKKGHERGREEEGTHEYTNIFLSQALG